MSKGSYARGFCKAAAAAGIDSLWLAKFAQARRPVRYRHLTSEEQKKLFFPRWYSYLNPGNYIAAGLARKEVSAPSARSPQPNPTIGGNMHTVGTIATPAPKR